VLVLKSDLNVRAPLTRVEYQSYGDYAAGHFYELELKLCHTPLAELTTNFNANYGGNTPVLVATANPFTINGRRDEWFGLDCAPAFDYNGVDNLVVEIRWRNQQLTTKVEVWAYTASGNRLLIYKDYNATQGDLSPKTDRLRLTFEEAAVAAASLGRIKVLLR
jgi:hypothetical protein